MSDTTGQRKQVMFDLVGVAWAADRSSLIREPDHYIDGLPVWDGMNRWSITPDGAVVNRVEDMTYRTEDQLAFLRSEATALLSALGLAAAARRSRDTKENNDG